MFAVRPSLVDPTRTFQKGNASYLRITTEQRAALIRHPGPQYRGLPMPPEKRRNAQRRRCLRVCSGTRFTDGGGWPTHPKDSSGNKCVISGRRGARLARRDERAYRAYVSEEQQSQAGCIGVQNGTVTPGRVLRTPSVAEPSGGFPRYR